MAARRITYAAVTSVGALLFMVGVDFFLPQLAVVGMFILIGVGFSLLPVGIRRRARQLRGLAARLRGPTPTPATRYVPPTAARPVITPPSPRAYTDPMSHEAVIREAHHTTFPADGDEPQS